MNLYFMTNLLRFWLFINFRRSLFNTQWPAHILPLNKYSTKATPPHHIEVEYQYFGTQFTKHCNFNFNYSFSSKFSHSHHEYHSAKIFCLTILLNRYKLCIRWFRPASVVFAGSTLYNSSQLRPRKAQKLIVCSYTYVFGMCVYVFVCLALAQSTQ